MADLAQARRSGKLVLRRFADSETAETIGDLALRSEQAATIDEVRQLEASATALYFGACSGRAECEPIFATKDRSGSRLTGRADRASGTLRLAFVEALVLCRAHSCEAGLFQY